MQIQISWLLQKPTDLDLHCLQRQDISGFSRTRVKLQIGSLQQHALNLQSEVMKCNVKIDFLTEKPRQSCGKDIDKDTIPSDAISTTILGNSAAPDLESQSGTETWFLRSE